MFNDPLGETAGTVSARRSWFWLATALLLMVVVHLPSLQLGFVGDDFEWWLETVRRMDEPSRLLNPYGGLRLTNPVLLMPDQVLWKARIPGWHITNLVIHGFVMTLLFGVSRRLGLSPPVAGAVAAVWAISPYTAFQVREIHPRHDPLLFACWLGIALLWPGPGQKWSPPRAIAAATLALVSALTKESWVVLPGLAGAYELALRRRELVPALRTAALWSIGPLLYVAAYLVRPAVDVTYAAGYYGGGLAAAAKIPSTLAVFCGAARLDTSSLRFGPVEWLAVIALIAVAAITLKAQTPVLVAGMALFLLPFIPVVPVGFMIGRYAYVPFAGFLLLGVGLAQLAVRRFSSVRGRRLIVLAAGAAAIALAGTGLWVMRGEIADADRRDEGHRRLLEEAAQFWPALPLDRPLVCVRLERESINAQVLGQAEGLPKAYFERANYPYGLVRWAELESWTGLERGGPLWEEVPADEVGQAPFAVIGHVQGGFVHLPSEGETAASAAAAWIERGFPVRVIRPLPTE